MRHQANPSRPVSSVRRRSSSRATRRAIGLACLCLSAAPTLIFAERLPVTIYTTEQGLANNNVFVTMADSRGFVWLGTREGLSRFDGYRFTNHGVDDGLPGALVNDLLETRTGVYLVATSGGLARLEDSASSRPGSGRSASARTLFSVHEISADAATHHVTALHQTRDSRIWVGTRAGLFLVEDATAPAMRFRSVPLGDRADAPAEYVWDIAEDRFGTVWVATALGLRRVWPDGRVDAHVPAVGTQSVIEDRRGRIFAGTRLDGLVELTLDLHTGKVARTRAYTRRDGLPHLWIHGLLDAGDGVLWAASPGGLIQFTWPPSGNPNIRLFGEAHGVGRMGFQSLALDRSGNLWAGSAHGGAVKVAASGFTTFGSADGIAWASTLLQTRSNDFCLAGPGVPDWGLHCFDGIGFRPVQPVLRPGAGAQSWGWNQTVLQDHRGEWWFASREGVARFEKTDRPFDLHGRSPVRWYGVKDGIAASTVLRLFEDTRGDVWIAAVGEGAPNGLSRWERATGRLRHYAKEPNLPDLVQYFPTAFADDAAGNVWIGFSGDGGIVRYRAGSFDRLSPGQPRSAMVRNITRDSRGRLWIATYRGLIRVDEPAAERPRFTVLTTRDGLSSNEVTAVAEDLAGRLYLGTGRGLDRLDLATGSINRYSARDGYIPGEILAAHLDRRTGHLWFSQVSGVSRLVTPPGHEPLPPPILITGLEVAGEAHRLSVLGETSVAALSIAPGRNHLRIEFLALAFGPGEDLQYQYRLEGAQEDWTAPSVQRSVNFANLAPGRYRFLVRAVSSGALTSTDPAVVAFTILPPLWQRWWFVALAAAAAAALLHSVHRYRLRRALEIASVRTRIATDLHDDVGADLTKIAILSEVARRQLDGHDAAADRLGAIARISRESVSAMSDVVWAIHPERDTLLDTIRRMRQHAEEVLSGRGIQLHFLAPDTPQVIRLPIDVRRDVLLICKEAVNNAVRHARCRAVTIEIVLEPSRLQLRVSDDGVGFDPGLPSDAGNGLASMRRRARRMNATLAIDSAPDRGTTLHLSVPGSFGARLRQSLRIHVGSWWRASGSTRSGSHEDVHDPASRR